VGSYAFGGWERWARRDMTQYCQAMVSIPAREQRQSEGRIQILSPLFTGCRMWGMSIEIAGVPNPTLNLG